MAGKVILICLFLIGSFNANAEQIRSEIAFISDMQNPIWVESVLLKPYRNAEATDSLFADIAKRKLATLFILGDIVSVGSDVNLWKQVDDNLLEMNKAGIPVYAIPGNHEYMFFSSFGINNFRLRFPKLPLDGYYKIVDSIAIVLLNSNFGYMSFAEYNKQLNFYNRIIEQLDTSKNIKCIVVACHHSPFTNSSIVDPSLDVQNMFVPLFRKSRKTKIFMSGHSHNLEHFINYGKHYLVIGGGGGLKQPLYIKGYRKYKDEIDNNFKPIYFYVTIQRNGNSINITSRGLNEEFIYFDYNIATVTLD